MRFTRFAAASAALTMAVGAFTVSTSFADPPPVSTLVASPTSLTLDANPAAPVNVGDTPHSATVTVGLDEFCHQATDSTGYSIAAGTSDYVSVSPGTSGLPVLNCSPPAATTFTFTVTGVNATPPGGATLHFSPVAKNDARGLQKKVKGIDIPIVVIDSRVTIPPCQLDPTGCETSGGNPAAPAIANALINANPDLALACQAGRGKNWRGQVISWVADKMPKPESIKDTYSEEDWIDYVATELYTGGTGLYGKCGFVPPSA